MSEWLSEAQQQAILHVGSSAKRTQQHAIDTIQRILQRHGKGAVTIHSLLTSIRRDARVTLNFHPDRVLPTTNRAVIESLLTEGRYHNQFITSVTNGSRTAYPGGERDRWEQLLFGGAYQEPGVHNEERPKYGALNLMNYADGASPRFGSCFFVLSPAILSRCTFTFGDSHAGPAFTGTIKQWDSVLAALLLEVESTGSALGAPHMNIPSMVEQLVHLPSSYTSHSGPVGRSLDDYIEAQIHGVIDLSSDVEALVADPSYRNTRTGQLFQELCERYNLTLSWHPGFCLAVQDVPDDFRGPAMPPLAQRIDRQFADSQGVLDAAVIGKAAAQLYHQPDHWSDWGTYDETFQHLKQLWHVLVKYGYPNPNISSR
ncbi:hypothetical protein AWU65_30420 [Paenibacillus glucanolyticus]|uniref:DUF3626 domain-containing protein n=1 Tax=Paenibacillus glucanolyticus TaxID=59843 RepID=A0A163FGP4_9BACL|nr:DUF3626 domain-containing protein [Paenibacillus glucanolyticus]KZS44376.1 hypothetical protein AWU65_30420 [Paenibacillus glucanolyticus]